MKSKKVNEYLSKCIEVQKLTFCAADIEYAVGLAEQEAEERLRRKAIKAHRACCPSNELQCIHRDRDDYTCTYDCRYIASFIQKLGEE